jgi:hypothetical protein
MFMIRHLIMHRNNNAGTLLIKGRGGGLVAAGLGIMLSELQSSRSTSHWIYRTDKCVGSICSRVGVIFRNA